MLEPPNPVVGRPRRRFKTLAATDPTPLPVEWFVLAHSCERPDAPPRTQGEPTIAPGNVESFSATSGTGHETAKTAVTRRRGRRMSKKPRKFIRSLRSRRSRVCNFRSEIRSASDVPMRHSPSGARAKVTDLGTDDPQWRRSPQRRLYRGVDSPRHARHASRRLARSGRVAAAQPI